MTEVFTPDGWGQVLRTGSAYGRTSYFVKGAGFEGWYDGLQVTADFADQPDDVVPNEDNNTVLPYPSEPQGPGWDPTNSTIQPGTDPHLDMGHASDSLSGDSTSEDPVEADIEGLFEPHSRLSGVRPHRVHFANMDDPILDVSTIPDDSPVGLDNSPINPDNVSTDDLFDGESFAERTASYDRLVIEDDLSFLKYAADDDSDDDDKKKNHHERDGISGFPKDDDDDNDDDSDDDDDSSSDGSDSSSGGDSDGGGDSGDGGGGHTAAVSLALSATADLHFLANFCTCAEALPLHSKLEHRELVAEGKLKDRRKKNSPLGSKPLKGQHGEHDPKTPGEAGYDKAAHAVADLVTPKRKGRKKRPVERPIQYSAAGSDEVKPQEADWDNLYDRYTQDHFTSQESNLENLVDHSQDDGDSADLWNHYSAVKTAEEDGYDKYIGSNGDGTYHLIASGGGKLPKGKQYGHYDSYQDAHDAVEAIIARNHSRHGSKTAAPAQQDAQPTQIESQIEQLMQFWAVDNNGWWHWTGSQADLALLNQMQQQMTAVGMPGGPPGQMQAQSAFQVEDDTPPRWREYLHVLASDRLTALAAWRDVVDKSKRLRAEGAIEVEAFRPDVITAYIQGDNGRYYTTVQRLGSVAGAKKQLTSTQVSGWSCDCEWGHWAWLRKRSFVGRMCSHAYALFSEMRSLDAKARKAKGQPGRFASVGNKSSWSRTPGGGFDWVTTDLALPTATIAKTATGWNAYVWSDGTSEDHLSLGTFAHSNQAQRAIARVVTAHVKLADMGDVDVVGGAFPPYQAPDSISGGGYDPYSADGTPEPLLDPSMQPGSAGVQESTTRTGAFSAFAEHDDGQDDEGPEADDDGIQEEDPEDESLDEEIAEDEDNSDDGQDDEGEEPEPDDDGGHEEPHKRDDSEDDDEGTDNPGDESDDDHIEKESVAQLQEKFGLTHLAGANYSLADQNRLVSEGEGKLARNHGELNLTGTHYEANASDESPEDTLAFLF